MIVNKEKQLEELNKEIAGFVKEKGWEEIWLEGIFLPKYYFPHQYEAVFVSIQPSTFFLKNPHLRFLGNFNALKTNIKMQKRMIRFGFGGSYVTDIVKLQRPAKQRPLKEEIEMFLPFLKREIEIINPKIVVTLGEEAYNALNKYKDRLGINKKLFKIFHPAGTAAKTEKERDEQFEKLRKEIKTAPNKESNQF